MSNVPADQFNEAVAVIAERMGELPMDYLLDQLDTYFAESERRQAERIATIMSERNAEREDLEHALCLMRREWAKVRSHIRSQVYRIYDEPLAPSLATH